MNMYILTTAGHGKLSLGDGGYYEGTFAYGEIEGHGYRVFGLTGATYSGQFHRGEMHGQGILQYPNGEVYEGSWAKGRREGELLVLSRSLRSYMYMYMYTSRYNATMYAYQSLEKWLA